MNRKIIGVTVGTPLNPDKILENGSGGTIINSSSGKTILTTDSANAPLVNLKAKGDTWQKQYEGKNLWDGEGIFNGYNSHGLYANENTRTCYIKCLPNADYTVSKIVSTRFSVGYSYEFPSVGVVVYNTITDNEAPKITCKIGRAHV